MKARLKINYLCAEKGQIFKVVDFQGKRITLDIDGKSVDFGFSEVAISATTNQELFNLGKELMLIQSYGFAMRDSDIRKAIRTIQLPIENKLAFKAISHYIYSSN